MAEQIKHIQLDENEIVKAISWLNEDESDKGLIVVSDLIEVGIGYAYDSSTQIFTPPEPSPEPESKASMEEVTEETLLETKYQTFLLEMMI